MMLARNLLVVSLALVAASCVTINVYFPAAAAEKAADKIIDEVWGKQPGSPPAPSPQSRRAVPAPAPDRLLLAVLDLLVPAAHAQADLDISTPAIQRLQASMKARFRSLRPFYGSGAVGLTRDGLIAVRDAKLVPLRQRQAVKGLVAAENRDRTALYKEIARANRHPEWEGNIRSTFARRWVARAESGWWYDLGNGWQRKP